MSDLWFLILVAGALTYGTRVAGHLVLSRFETIPPRLDAALNAVPPAMLITLVVPQFVDGGWLERGIILLAGILALRLSVLSATAIGVATIVMLRQFGF